MKVKIDNFAQFGIIRDKPAHELPIGAWSDGNNVTFRDGKLQKAEGNTEVYDGVACRPQYIMAYEDPDSGDYHWIYPGLDDNGYGKIFTVTGTTHTNRTRKNADAITSDISTTGSPCTVTMASTTYNDGDEVVIAGVTTAPVDINGTWTLTKISATQFSIVANVTSAADKVGTASIDSDYSPSLTIPWTGGIINGLAFVNNGVDIPQKWDRTGGTLNGDFEDLANWTTGWKARSLRSYKDFLIAMDIDDTAGGGSPTRNPYRVAWSDAVAGFTEPSTWTAAATNLAGDAYLTEGDDYVVDGGTLRDSFIIYKENSCYSMRYVGGNAVMQVDRLFNDIGLLAIGCFVEYIDGLHFVVTKGDIVVHDGNTSRSVVDDKIKHKIFDEIDSTYYVMAFCAHYYKEEEIWFCYSTGADGLADKAAIWNYRTEAWSFRDLNNCPHIGEGIIVTTGGEDWDTVATNWNTETGTWSQAVYSPSANELIMIERGATEAAANDTTALAEFQQVDSGNTFDGSAMTSYARTEKLDIKGQGVQDPSQVAFLNRLYPKVSGGPVKFRVGHSMSQEDIVIWSDYYTYDPSSSNYKLDVRETGRFLALEISSNTDVDWQLHSMDMDIDITSEAR